MRTRRSNDHGQGTLMLEERAVEAPEIGTPPPVPLFLVSCARCGSNDARHLCVRCGDFFCPECAERCLDEEGLCVVCLEDILDEQ